MATQSVAIAKAEARVSVPLKTLEAAEQALDETTNLLEGVEGTIHLVAESMSNTAESKAIWGALALVRQAFDKASSVQADMCRLARPAALSREESAA